MEEVVRAVVVLSIVMVFGLVTILVEAVSVSTLAELLVAGAVVVEAAAAEVVVVDDNRSPAGSPTLSTKYHLDAGNLQETIGMAFLQSFLF